MDSDCHSTVFNEKLSLWEKPTLSVPCVSLLFTFEYKQSEQLSTRLRRIFTNPRINYWSEHFPDVFTSSASVSLQSLLFCFLFISALVESCTFINKQLEYFSKYKCVHKLKVCEKGKGWTVRDVRWSQRWSRKSLSFWYFASFEFSEKHKSVCTKLHFKKDIQNIFSHFYTLRWVRSTIFQGFTINTSQKLWICYSLQIWSLADKSLAVSFLIVWLQNACNKAKWLTFS